MDSSDTQIKKMAADILIALIQKEDFEFSKEGSPDKIGDYFSIIYRRIKDA